MGFRVWVRAERWEQLNSTLAPRQVCTSDGYSYERAEIEMYVKQKRKDSKPIVSPMDSDKVSALNTASHVLGYC